MATLFLLLIYLTFISLGLPDSLLGSAWPVIRADLGAPLDAAGMISAIVSVGTIISSLLSERMINRFGTGKVTAVSVAATAAALLMGTLANSVWWLMLISVPLGLGAGAVDAALNNYVALHYKPIHLNWLHCFWGVGTFVSPLVIGASLNAGNSWRSGYLIIGIFQVCVSALLFISLPVWKKREKLGPEPGAGKRAENYGEPAQSLPAGKVIRMPGVAAALLTMLLYCALELCGMLWGASYLAGSRGFSAADAASAASLFFLGITIGRFVSGIFSLRLSSKTLIRAGCFVALAGAALLAAPLPAWLAPALLFVVGFGCAPIYPSTIHETPHRFGAANSQKIIGWQMAAAYTGSTLSPMVVGFVAARVGTAALPWFMIAFAIALILTSEWVDLAVKRSANAKQASN